MSRFGSIPLDFFFDVTSTGVRDVFSLNQLPTILVVKNNANLPQREFEEVLSPTQAKNQFGFDSYIGGFSDVYFGVTSKKATKPERLWIYSWAENGSPESIKGAEVTNSIFGLSGDFGISLNGTVKNFTVDFAGLTSFTAIANALQTEINTDTEPALATATVKYSVYTKGFVLTLGALTEFNVEIVEGTANDIHYKLGLTYDEGAIFIQDQPSRSFEEMLSRIETNNGNYYAITTGFDLVIDEGNDIDQIKDFGEFINASNDRFIGVYAWSNKQFFVLGSKLTEKYLGYNGLMFDTKQDKYTHAFLCGLISAMNLSLVAGNYNIAWNDASIFNQVAIDDKAKAEAMYQNKGNAPLYTGILGQTDTIYMNGSVMGNKTNSSNIYICNSYLKFAIQIALYNMSKSQDIISLRGTRGFGFISSYLDEVFNRAVEANIIVTGAELTTTEKNVIISNFPKNAEKALTQIQKEGYYYEINRIDTVTRRMYITQAYMGNMPVDKIIINNYILGA